MGKQDAGERSVHLFSEVVVSRWLYFLSTTQNALRFSSEETAHYCAAYTLVDPLYVRVVRTRSFYTTRIAMAMVKKPRCSGANTEIPRCTNPVGGMQRLLRMIGSRYGAR